MGQSGHSIRTPTSRKSGSNAPHRPFHFQGNEAFTKGSCQRVGSAASATAFVLALYTKIGFRCCTAMRINEIVGQP